MVRSKIEVKKWDIYWFLTIEKEVEPYIKGCWKPSRKFLCKCICWKTKEFILNSLRSWTTKSCWCFSLSIRTTHWMTWSRFYNTYRNMKLRTTYKKHPQYKDYGWRWIKVEWDSFEQFKEDMYASYLSHEEIHWTKDTTIDRRDNDWNYCKNNCRWATMKEQNRNCSNNRVYKWKCVSQWCEELWLKPSTVRNRINIGKKTIPEAIWINNL